MSADTRMILRCLMMVERAGECWVQGDWEGSSGLAFSLPGAKFITDRITFNNDNLTLQYFTLPDHIAASARV